MEDRNLKSLEKPAQASLSAEVRFLDPKAICFNKRGAALEMVVEGEATFSSVIVRRAFPMMRPDEYLSVCNSENKEIGMIRTLLELPESSQKLLQEDLERRYMVPMILRAISVKDIFGAVEWEVETNRGPKKFIVQNIRENIQRISANRYILTDAEENRYEIRDLSLFDPKSRMMVIEHL